MSNKSIPIIFAVTGHRDLLSKNINHLKQSIGSILQRYKKKYKHTDIVLISALAEGADMLVAEVALNLGIAVKVILPYEQDKYLKSFDNEKSTRQFNKIIEHKLTTKPTILDTNSNDPNQCYDNLGKHLANNCNILIALWDGKNTYKKGGTSEVVKYMREGSLNDHFESLDGNALIVINTPRKSNPIIHNPLEIQESFLANSSEEFHTTIAKVDELNASFRKSEYNKTEQTLIHSIFNYLESTANSKQKRYKRFHISILIASWLAIVSLEIMHTIEGKDLFVLGYIFGLIIAFLLFYFAGSKGKVQKEFIYFRGLSEAIRVQNAWNYAKLKAKERWQTNESVANYYLADEHNKFIWIKMVIKNISYIDSSPFTLYDKKNYDEIGWINSQAAYFVKESKNRHRKLEFWERIEKFLYYLGLGTLIVMAGIFFLELFKIIEPGELWFNWHYLILASGIPLLTAAFIGEKYLKIEAYKEELYDFNLMKNHFNKAQNLLKDTSNKEQTNKVIFDLGIKALKENSKWVVLHHNRIAKFSTE